MKKRGCCTYMYEQISGYPYEKRAFPFGKIPKTEKNLEGDATPLTKPLR